MSDTVVWKNPCPHGEGRRESLLQIMMDTFDEIVLPYYRRGFILRNGDGIGQAENHSENVKCRVLDGLASLSDYRTACEGLVEAIQAVNQGEVQIIRRK